MDRTQLEAVFDQQATHYDQQWAKLAAFRDALHLLIASVFSRLPPDAKMLCVGAGTGAEIDLLASRFPDWRFVAIEPSAGMVAAGRARAEARGYARRCHFHHGYLDSLPDEGLFDCATSLLVSQFLLDRDERGRFFRSIGARLKPGGVLASSDLSVDTDAPGYASLLEVWLRTMAAADLSAERLQQMRSAYDRDVAILPPAVVEGIIESAGFGVPVPFFQAGLIRAWYAERVPELGS